MINIFLFLAIAFFFVLLVGRVIEKIRVPWIFAALIFGFLFGAILQFANLNKYNVISGLAVRKDFAVAKAIAVAIGIGAILLNFEIAFGLASYHVKPFIFGGIILGGLIFGAGMAILGYCPGTLAISSKAMVANAVS